MEFLEKGYWYSITEETDFDNEDGSVSQSPGGDETALPDPDFEEVSEMLRGENTPSPSPSSSPAAENDVSESVDYVPYLENISVQLGVIDIVLVLFLLIFIIKQFVRVPR